MARTAPYGLTAGIIQDPPAFDADEDTNPGARAETRQVTPPPLPRSAPTRARPPRRWSEVPATAMGEVVDVLTFGLGKHGKDRPWRDKDPDRHYDAMMRHLGAYREGQRADPESGCHPLAHALARGLFALALELRGKR